MRRIHTDRHDFVSQGKKYGLYSQCGEARTYGEKPVKKVFTTVTQMRDSGGSDQGSNSETGKKWRWKTF